MQNNDIYAISGRVKNHIANADIAISQVGNVLVNYFTLMIKELYDFSDTLPQPNKDAMVKILTSNEKVPMNIIKVASPEPEKEFFEVRCWDAENDKEFVQTMELDDIVTHPYGIYAYDLATIAINKLRKQQRLSPIPKGLISGDFIHEDFMELTDDDFV